MQKGKYKPTKRNNCAYVFDKIADLLGLTKGKIQQLTWNIKRLSHTDITCTVKVNLLHSTFEEYSL